MVRSNQPQSVEQTRNCFLVPRACVRICAPDQPGAGWWLRADCGQPHVAARDVQRGHPHSHPGARLPRAASQPFWLLPHVWRLPEQQQRGEAPPAHGARLPRGRALAAARARRRAQLRVPWWPPCHSPAGTHGMSPCRQVSMHDPVVQHFTSGVGKNVMTGAWALALTLHLCPNGVNVYGFTHAGNAAMSSGAAYHCALRPRAPSPRAALPRPGSSRLHQQLSSSHLPWPSLPWPQTMTPSACVRSSTASRTSPACSRSSPHRPWVMRRSAAAHSPRAQAAPLPSRRSTQLLLGRA